MGGNQPNWGAIHLRRKQAQGQLSGVDTKEKNPLRALFKEDGERNKRLTRYLAYGPRGERDVEPLLDALEAQLLPQEPRRPDGRLPPRQTRAERNTWLQGVLEAWEE
jgi:hypothetical protein